MRQPPTETPIATNMELLFYGAAILLILYWIIGFFRKQKMSNLNTSNDRDSLKTSEDWLSEFEKLRLKGDLIVEIGESSNANLANLDQLTASIFNQYKSVFVPQGDLKISIDLYQNKNSGENHIIGASETDRYWFYVKQNDPKVYSHSFDSDWDKISDTYENIIDLITDYVS